MRMNLQPARTNNSRREPKIKIGVGEDQGKCSAMKTIWQHLQKRSPDHDAGQDKRNADQAHYQALRFEFEISYYCCDWQGNDQTCDRADDGLPGRKPNNVKDRFAFQYFE